MRVYSITNLLYVNEDIDSLSNRARAVGVKVRDDVRSEQLRALGVLNPIYNERNISKVD